MVWFKTSSLQFIIISIGILIILYWFSTKNVSEGFEALYTKATDRANPLASAEHPLNDTTRTGMSEGDSYITRSINQAALNIPTLSATSQGTFSEKSSTLVSPRIDNENSFLGMVKFCKDNGTAQNPFTNTKFAENCGVCFTSGSTIDGTTYDGQTQFGLLVYDEDKKKFLNEKSNNSYLFTHAIPSLGAGTCGTSVKDPNSPPSFAITQTEYNAFRNRAACRNNTPGALDCGTCLTTGAKSWINLKGGLNPVTILLWGLGTATISVDEYNLEEQTLSMTTPATYNLGTVQEGILISIRVTNASLQRPYVYGGVYSTTASGSVYRFPIDSFINIDVDTGRFFSEGDSRTFTVSGGTVSCVQIKAARGRNNIHVRGRFPLTFVDSNQLAAYDCETSPYKLDSSSGYYSSQTDSCLNPQGQGVDNYSDGCLRASLLSGGCLRDGTWYKDPDVLREDHAGKSTVQMKTAFQAGSTRDKNFMMKCKGIDISTPCDPFLSASSASSPNQACMTYLYTNASADSEIVGPAYSGTPYISNPTGTQLPFCQSAGSLNPASAAGLAQLQSAAQGYHGATGISAVKSYLTDVFAKATSDLPQNLPDSNGGRYDSWGKCIGTTVQLATVPGIMNVDTIPGNTLADITWTTPNTGGVPITGYVVTYNPLEPSGSVSMTGTNTARITGLRNGVIYMVSVVANNIMGTSTPGSKTVTPIQPVCPTAGQLVPAHNSQCDSSGRRQKYVFKSDTNGACISDISGARFCDSTCPTATLQGGCAY